jgi:acyl-[acyl-carrier-protein]-phospholipid O-acyltransferase / long-chain-fatty-acid--[acyl-carrier-protein] ligase
MKNLIRFLLRCIARILFRVRLRGHMTRLHAEKLLLIANHESYIDGLLIGLFIPLNPVFVVHTGVVQNWFFRSILGLVDYVAVDPTSPMAMKSIIKLIDAGRPVVIFPEGRITLTGNLMKVYDGPAFVAAKTQATIIPIRLDGASRTYFSRLSGKYPRRFFPQITISILPPTSITMPATGTAKLRRRKAGEAMRRLMQEMLFASRPEQSLIGALIDAMQIFGRSRRLVEDIKQIEYSYGDLLKMTLMLGRLAARLSKPGEHIGLLLPNIAPTLGLLIGLSAFRRVPAMLNYTAGTEGMQNACIAGDVHTILTSKAFLEQAKIADKVSALKNVRLVFLEDLRENLSIADKLWWIGFARWFPRIAKPSGGSPEDAAVILFTSGSEGKPKGVVLSHRAILANIAQIRAVVDFSVDDKVLNALPVFHSFGLTAGALLPLLTGARIFLYPTPLHYRIIPELAYDRSCTVLFGTSTFLGNYARFAHPYDFYKLRYVIAGAEKLSPAVRDTWFEKFGIRIFEGYGATETAPVLAVNTPMAYRSGTVGQLLPGISFRLTPVPGIERGGVLHVSGPNVMSGYLKFENPGQLMPPESEAGIGWYDTGDVVEIDEDDFLRIVGRIKRFAKIAGEMISLESVEKLAVTASPAFFHAASTQEDAQRGEAIVLFTTDPNLNRESLQQVSRENGYPEIVVPRKIVALEILPLLGTGKIDYVSLQQLAVTT